MRPRAVVVAVVLLAAAAAASFALGSGRGGGPRPAAAAAIAACSGAAAIDFGCFERRYTALARERGARAALRDLVAQRARNGYVRAACHQLTHRIGRAAGALRGMAAFSDGRPLCSSGYYHGVIEAVMAKIGSAHVLARAEAVCAPLRTGAPRSADHYNCSHGMGHGFMGAFSSDVFAALRGCDALAAGWERHHCYGGVFMENLSAIDNPQRPSRDLRPREPLYPCTALARRYKTACLDKQTTYALYVTGSDFAAVFKLCVDVGGGFRRACVRGLGGDVAIDTAKHVFDARAKAAARRELCLLPDGARDRADCVVGAVRVILRDLTDPAAEANAFCAAFGPATQPRLRAVCRAARAAAYRELPLQPGSEPPSIEP